MASISFILWALAAGSLWKPHPADLEKAATGFEPLLPWALPFLPQPPLTCIPGLWAEASTRGGKGS